MSAIHQAEVDLDLLVNGKPVDSYTHEGRTFVEGKPGTEYSLRIRNTNNRRVKVVATVDSVSVLTGKAASGTSDEMGYIVDAHDTLTIKGYRIDNNNVAAFRFVEKESSYAKETKKMDGTTGVIGLKVWEEKVKAPAIQWNPPPIIKEHHHHYWPTKPWYYEDHYWYGPTWRLSDHAVATYTCNSSLGDGSTIGAARSMNCASSIVTDDAFGGDPFVLGSTFGEKVESRVTEVTFEVGACLGELALFYTTRAGLVALGVDLKPRAKVSFPQAFGSKYCEVPANWKG